MLKKPELLAPAGDIERLKIALLYGADAVYIGGSLFSLRANAINFTEEDIKEALAFAHNLGKKVYVTVNISLHSKEVSLLVDYLKQLDHMGVDAIIVSDPAVIMLAHEYTKLEIHLSTQQSTLNYEAVNFWKSIGVTRIVLAREASGSEIKDIIDKCDMEIETFIHGAMCTAYSGRCVLSNFFTARDSNRGGCSQICRWNFNLLDENKHILEGAKEFTFSPKDLSHLKYIPQMIDMGICSFKIEGRMRSVYYIATVVSTYRKVIDNYLLHKESYKYDINHEEVLNNVANRDSISQFLDNNYSKETQYYNGRAEVSNQDFLGIVLDYKDGLVTLEQRNYFEKGNVVEFFGPHTTFEATIEEIYDVDGSLIDIVRHPKQIVKIKLNQPVEPFDMMRIKKLVDKQSNI